MRTFQTYLGMPDNLWGKGGKSIPQTHNGSYITRKVREIIDYASCIVNIKKQSRYGETFNQNLHTSA